MTTAEKIDSILKERGLSRRQVAIRANIPPSSFQSAMERNGNMSSDMLKKIAKALDVEVYELLTGHPLRAYKWGYVEGYNNESMYQFTKEEASIVSKFNRLNPEGQKKAVERVEELTEIPKYQKEKNPPQE